MSALAHEHNLFSPKHRFSEPNATYEVSRIASSATDRNTALDEIAAVLLHTGGITHLEIESASEALSYKARRGGRNKLPQQSVPAEVAANGRHWGRLQLYFDSRAGSFENAARFAAFLAQQIAGMLNRFALVADRDRYTRSVAALHNRLTTYKLVQRAKGIVAERQNNSEHDALRFLLSYSRASRLSLRRG